jgi:hypothetical protein
MVLFFERRLSKNSNFPSSTFSFVNGLSLGITIKSPFNPNGASHSSSPGRAAQEIKGLLNPKRRMLMIKRQNTDRFLLFAFDLKMLSGIMLNLLMMNAELYSRGKRWF